MDNTGYIDAYQDAKQSEALLKDFCDHLLTLPNICFVTTKELNDPNWEPPFKYGLIILNLTVHADEATPGIHMTCIPYSRDCKRGPRVQPSLGRAMTGMGYPSTWKDIRDENGERIPKRTRNGEIVHNKDGSIRYQQEPDKQGIIDWIEEQKLWIHGEMKKRYDWDRESKGSHPRGNLSTPDYKAARAKERVDEYARQINAALITYQNRVNDLSHKLEDSIDRQWHNATNQDIINRYLEVCSDEEYESFVKTAAIYLKNLAITEQQKADQSLQQKILQAKAQTQKKGTNSKRTLSR